MIVAIRILLSLLLFVCLTVSPASGLQDQYYPATAYVKIVAYGASLIPLAPQAAAQKADDTAERLKRLEEKLDRLLKLLEQQGGQPAAAQQPGAAPSALVSAATKCAACHFPDVADEKGVGFTFFNKEGDIVAVPERDRRRAIDRINSDDPKKKMPPPASGALTAAEKTELLKVFAPPAK